MGIFKGIETVERVTGSVEKFGNLEREIGVLVEKTRPIYEDEETGKTNKGNIRVDVVLCRGKGKLSVTPQEAKELANQIMNVHELASEKQRICDEEREAYFEKQRQRRNAERAHEPGVGGYSMGVGKTARKKAAGKAGEAYHKAKKSQKSANDREINASIGNVTKR